MNVTRLLARLASADVEVFADGENIKLLFDDGIDDGLIEEVRAYKPEVLTYLKSPHYTLWFYQLDPQSGYTRMGLMTADHHQAQNQLEAIYDKPITDLQRRQ